jgi:hypothetical protein
MQAASKNSKRCLCIGGRVSWLTTAPVLQPTCGSGPTQVRQCLKSVGMKPRKVGQILAKADVTAQEDCQTGQLAPRLEEAKSGQRIVCFMEAVHEAEKSLI